MSGSIYLVGIGPGGRDSMTPRARDRLKKVAVVIGHQTSLELVSELIANKETISREMSPVERAKLAVARAEEGKEVAVVSTGDPGIYAIASTFFSYLKENGLTVPVEVIPGITVASAAAASMGSPLGHDFAVISLADLATDQGDIKKRLEAAARADFVVVLYNPKGKVGDARIKEAVAILLTHRKETTPVGIAVKATTELERIEITTLGEISAGNIATDALVIIGNSETFVYNGKMVTPRGYHKGVGY
jgi:precorrin-3B C17-methyltransferase